MARPKKASPEPARTSRLDRATVINLKGTTEFAAWLESMHRETDIPKATIVRRALELWAKDRGKPAPPEI